MTVLFSGKGASSIMLHMTTRSFMLGTDATFHINIVGDNSSSSIGRLRYCNALQQTTQEQQGP